MSLTLTQLQVLPAANDSTTYYVGMQPVQSGRTTAEYVAPAIQFVPANNYLTLAGLPVITSNTTSSVNITNGANTTTSNNGALTVVGGVGVSGSVYVSNRLGITAANNNSVVYQVYNSATGTIDTVFG